MFHRGNTSVTTSLQGAEAVVISIPSSFRCRQPKSRVVTWQSYDFCHVAATWLIIRNTYPSAMRLPYKGKTA